MPETTIEFRDGIIARSRGNSQCIEIEVGSDVGTFARRCYRGVARDLAILAHLAAGVDGAAERDAIAPSELRDMIVDGAATIDAEGAAELETAWPAGQIHGLLGPEALDRASRQFFGRPYRAERGRHPIVMRLAPGAVCVRCGAAAEENHHITPRVEGGEDEIGNDEPLCRACHDREPAAALRPGWYWIELGEQKWPEKLMTITIARGACSGRAYRVAWGTELPVAPRCGAMLLAYLAPTGSRPPIEIRAIDMAMTAEPPRGRDQAEELRRRVAERTHDETERLLARARELRAQRPLSEIMAPRADINAQGATQEPTR